MESWMQFIGISILFIWCIKRIDAVKTELTTIRNNDLDHIYKEISNIYNLIIGKGIK